MTLSRKKLLFLSYHSLIDPSSGAAVSVCDLLANDPNIVGIMKSPIQTTEMINPNFRKFTLADIQKIQQESKIKG